MSDLRTDYTNDILAEEMNGKRRFKIVKSDGTAETVSIEDVTTYDQQGSLFSAGDFNKTNKKVNEAYSRPVNNNILINSNFANPVNQREYVSGTVVSQDMYTIDRWCISSGIKIELNTNGITLEMTSNDNDGKGWFIQRLEDTDFLTGKIVTYSAKINGVVYSNTVTLNKTSGLQGTIVGDGFNMYMGYAPSKDAYDIDIELQKDSSITIEWMKLEVGEIATPYVPRLYAEELQMCQRYYQVIWGGMGIVYCHEYGGGSFNTISLVQEMRIGGTASLNPNEHPTYYLNGSWVEFDTVTLATLKRAITIVVNKGGLSSGSTLLGSFPNIHVDAEL